ncbi:hypothetical protein D3H55_02240 [Bacillus salacetis]|uniref:Uncharacterized protein n=1 Tax=Bacillus salacetis TaxID=2315464 RepID=A0A3A1R6C3_9BACI|nr:hypothetical protein [Bacillus salacetis]RIW38378.1 hypothetical protein D3H55_02240 [Bacillus salacetis]
MNNLKLFLIIGAGIFSGMVLMTFIQLEKAEYRMEALGFIAASAAVYFLLLWIFQRGMKKAFTTAVVILALLAISTAMFHHVLFPAGH